MFVWLKDIYNSESKLTSLIVTVTFVFTNIVSISVPRVDHRVVHLEIQKVYAETAKRGIPWAFRPLRTNKSRITREELESRNAIDNTEAKQQERIEVLNYVEGKVSYDYAAYQKSGGVTVANKSRSNSSTSSATTVNKRRSIRIAKGKRNAAKSGIGEANYTIGTNSRLKRFNSSRYREVASDSRRISYKSQRQNLIEGEEGSNNELASINNTQNKIQESINQSLNEAKRLSDKSGDYSDKSSQYSYIAIGLFIAALVCFATGYLAIIGAILLIAGLVMLYLSYTTGQKADDYSAQADAIYREGLGNTYSTNDYVNKSLSERDQEANEIERLPASAYYNGSSSSRDKASSYRQNISNLPSSGYNRGNRRTRGDSVRSGR